MGGNVSFQDALKQRLDIMQVSRQQMQAFLDSHPPQLSPGGLQGYISLLPLPGGLGHCSRLSSESTIVLNSI